MTTIIKFNIKNKNNKSEYYLKKTYNEPLFFPMGTYVETGIYMLKIVGTYFDVVDNIFSIILEDVKETDDKFNIRLDQLKLFGWEL